MSMVQNNACAIIIIIIFLAPFPFFVFLSLVSLSNAIVLAGQRYSMKDFVYCSFSGRRLRFTFSRFILRFTLFDAFKYVRSCHGGWCLPVSEHTAWCEIMTSENDNESNGKEPIFYKFLTSCMLFSPLFDMMETPEARYSCRCRHGTT